MFMPDPRRAARTAYTVNPQRTERTPSGICLGTPPAPRRSPPPAGPFHTLASFGY